MKTNVIVLGSLALAGAGIWYFFIKNRQFTKSGDQDYVGHVQKEESGVEHIRQVFHKAKEFVPEIAL